MRKSLGTNEPGPPELEIGRMRRRHLKGVLAIERQVYPRPWSPSLFISEMSEQRNRVYLVAREAPKSVFNSSKRRRNGSRASSAAAMAATYAPS